MFERGSTYYKDCAHIMSDATYAITSARYDFWHDLSRPLPIGQDALRSRGWVQSDTQVRNCSDYPTNPEWVKQFGNPNAEPKC